jgi:hypothetical protein
MKRKKQGRARPAAAGSGATAAAEALARLLADAAARPRQPTPTAPTAESEEARRLIAAMGTDDAAIERFFASLATELQARGAMLPPLEELPPSVLPLLAAADVALAPGVDGTIDFEAAASALDAALGEHLGQSPRQARATAQRDRMRQEIAASVAASMRRHGLTPACDLDDDLDEPPDSDAG